LRVLVNNLEGMVFRCAIDEQWTVHFVSDGSRELTGYCPDELEYNRFTSWSRSRIRTTGCAFARA
jgi:hypothetical protein